MTSDAAAYLARHDARLLATPEGRRVLTKLDPKLFAIVYFGRHLKSPDTGGEITFSEFHAALCADALRWTVPNARPKQSRTAYVAPRASGKSTWLFLIVPIWMAAHGHTKFAACFADSASQAETHLQTLRGEFTSNQLLRKDFPELCRPARRAGAGSKLADNRMMIQQENGFTCTARGIDSSVLGMKVGDQRPTFILLDDAESGESMYSEGQAEKRLTTIVDDVLPLNEFAHVAWSGTVTMPESLTHQLTKTVTHPHDEVPQWILDENFRCRYFPAILANDDGTERSLWPEKWPVAWLQGERHKRSFRKNFQNDPLGIDGEYWTVDDITYGDLEAATRTCLWIDPAVTTKRTSDQTGLAVVSWSPSEKRCCVRYVEGVRLSGEALRAKVLRILERFPEIKRIFIEGNQGADAWLSVFHDVPCRIEIRHTGESKEIRAARTLTHYQSSPPRVVHSGRFFEAEGQLVAFPRGGHDDQMDAIMGGVGVFLDRRAVTRASIRVESYL